MFRAGWRRWIGPRGSSPRRMRPRLHLESLETRLAPATLNPGDLLIADPNALGGTGGIFRVDPASGAQTTLSAGGSFVDPRGITIAPDGTLFVADPNAFGGNGGIIQVDATSGAQTTVASGGFLVDPEGIAVAPDGTLLIADPNAFGGNGGIIRVDRATGTQTPVSSGGNFVDPQGIAVAADGTLFVADPNAFGGNGGIIRVNPVTGVQTPISSGGNFVDPTGIVLEANGTILVVDPNAFGGPGGVVEVDPVTGAQTPLASGGNFVNPSGIALAANGDILVADPDAFGGNGGIIRVNPVTGIQTGVSSGGSFVDPIGIAVVPLPVSPSGPPSPGPPALPAPPGSVSPVPPPAPRPQILVTGPDEGGLPEIKVYDAGTGVLKFDFFAYNPAFRGGVRVAVGDVNGDGVPDIVTGAGPGGPPEIKVFSGLDGSVLADFFPFNPAFTGGIFVAAADVNHDGCADLVVGRDAGGAPEVKVFSGRNESVLYDFFAFNPLFSGGVRVAAGDVNGDGYADVITATGPGAAPEVKVFSGLGGIELQDYFAYAATFTGGVFVAAGAIARVGRADVITAPGSGGPEVKVFDGAGTGLIRDFLAYQSNGPSSAWIPIFGDLGPSAPRGGLMIGAGAVNAGGLAHILTGAGPGQPPEVKAIDGMSLAVVEDFFAYDPTFRGGVFVAGGS